ncbi:MAG: hypothetical protein ACMUJM_22305 [bacterium]
MSKNRKDHGKKAQEWSPWLIAAFTALSVNLAAEAVIGTFGVWASRELGCFSKLRFGYILFFIICVILFIRSRGKFFPPRTRHLKQQAIEKRKHLVLFLSNLKPTLEKTAGIPEELKLSDDIHHDIQTIESLKKGDSPLMWKWEMPLRGIAYHLEDGTQKGNALETVTIICSEASIHQIKLFYALCIQYRQLKSKTFYLLAKESEHTILIPLSSSIDIENFQGYNFEDFDEIVEAMDRMLYEFACKGYSHKDTIVDITGGQKPTSIVAAAMTFNLEIRAQYVQTNAPWDVKGYDVVLSSWDTKGLGI